MPDALFGTVIEDELLRAAFPTGPNACAPCPRGMANAALLRAGLISAYFAKTSKFWRPCVASCALLRSAAVLAADLERSEYSTMADKPCNDEVIKRHSCLEVAF